MKTMNIKLDKEQYLAGETVKGTINILANKDIRLQNFKLQCMERRKRLWGIDRVEILFTNLRIVYTFSIIN
jgi:hypothetical protein